MSFWEQSGFHSRIVIIHPNYRYHRYLLAKLLNLGNPLYLRADRLEDDAFCDHHTYDFLILDEFDRVPEPEATKFLDYVIDSYLSKGIIIFSRHLPLLTARQQRETSIFPIDAELGLIDFYQTSKTVVEFFGFGAGSIAINGRRQDHLLDKTQLALLFYLMEHGCTNRNTLLNLFWKGIRPKIAIRALHNLKSQLRESLGLELIIFHRGFYRLNPAYELVYDVAIYRRLIDAAQYSQAKLGSLFFAQAWELYKGAYLQTYEMDWVKILRKDLAIMQADAQAHLGRVCAEEGQKEQAARWYSLAFKHNPLREDVLAALLELFFELGFSSNAIAFFESHREILSETYGIQPSRHLESFIDLAS